MVNDIAHSTADRYTMQAAEAFGKHGVPCEEPYKGLFEELLQIIEECAHTATEEYKRAYSYPYEVLEMEKTTTQERPQQESITHYWWKMRAAFVTEAEAKEFIFTLRAQEPERRFGLFKNGEPVEFER